MKKENLVKFSNLSHHGYFNDPQFSHPSISQELAIAIQLLINQLRESNIKEP